MLSAIISSNIVPSFARSSATRANSAFDGALVSAASSAKASTGDVLQISGAAKGQTALPAAPQFDTEYFHRLSLMPDDEMKAEVLKQADAISASQGLPSGKFNFRSMTGGQGMVVVNALMNTPGVDQNAVDILSMNISYDMLSSQKTNDFVKPIAGYLDYAKNSDPANVKRFSEAIAFLASRSPDLSADNPYTLYRTVSQNR